MCQNNENQVPTDSTRQHIIRCRFWSDRHPACRTRYFSQPQQNNPRMSSTETTSTEKWSRYWAGDRVAACMADASGSYGDQLGQQWRDWFAQLAADSRILDLATGNGALIHLALDSAIGSSDQLQLFGVDYADIQPWAHLDDHSVDHRRIQFYGRTNIEQLPFATGMFNAVISQYGAEYAAHENTIDEAVRVLAPGGRLRWVCHHQHSSIYANTCKEIEHAEFVLHEARPHEHLLQLLQRQISAGQFIADAHQRTANTPERLAMTAALQACMNRLRASQPASECLDMVLQNLAYLYQHREQHAPTLVLEKVAEVEVELQAFLGRMQALADAALDAAGLLRIQQRLAQQGMVQIKDSFARKSNGAILGVVITATKPLHN